MKTSVNLPEWLLQELREINPDVNTSTLVKDALLIALPAWRKAKTTNPVQRALEMQLREVRAKTARDKAVELQKQRAARPPRARAKAPGPGPGALPARPTARAVGSGPKTK